MFASPRVSVKSSINLHGRNISPNNAGMKNRTDLHLGEVVFTSIINHVPDSSLNLLNACDFFFYGVTVKTRNNGYTVG